MAQRLKDRGTALKKNDILTLTVESYNGEGLGVARYEGQVIFVHRGIRGETALCRIEKVTKHLAYARVVSCETPSPCRQESDCPYYGRCGGCDYRHMEYAEELYAKREKVQNAIRRLGGSDVELEAMYGAEETDGYRNKVQYPVAKDGAVGFFRARSHTVTDIACCRLETAAANAAAEALRAYMREYRVSGYDEGSHTGLIRHLYVRSNKAGECLICLLVNGEALPHENELVDIMRKFCPSAVGIVLGVNRERTNVILGAHYRTLWGSDCIGDELCGFHFSLSVPSFYQVNRRQAEVLYKKAVEYADLTGEETVLDLYCGVGTVTSVMAAKAKRAIGAEIVSEAIEDAKENARQNGLHNVEFFCGDAADIAEKLAAEALQPDVISVDPPRKGLAPELIGHIAAMAPRRVVYISCDPATLGRDIKLFADRGYTLTRAAAVDLFPRTQHVETVVLLSQIG